MTDGEWRLWGELKTYRALYGIHFRKQVPVGPFVVDFAAHGKKLVIEVDGEFHAEPERAARDGRRDAWLGERGYRVVRLRTGELDEAFDGCVEEILRALGVVG
ncbi:MAG: hypothetical protein DI629_03265 [Mesorhizobium amorphae]|nr:MAG: hypothetical protein DI629_03265 [Mesorhizobium amorphae]